MGAAPDTGTRWDTNNSTVFGQANASARCRHSALGRVRHWRTASARSSDSTHRLTFGMAEHLQRAIDRVCGHRGAASHGFEHDQTKGFVARGKDKHVGCGIDLGQLLARQHPHPDHIRVTRLELRFQRPHTTHDAGSLQLQVQKSVDVFLVRNSPHKQGVRARKPFQFRHIQRLGVVVKQFQVHPVGPRLE